MRHEGLASNPARPAERLRHQQRKEPPDHERPPHPGTATRGKHAVAAVSLPGEALRRLPEGNGFLLSRIQLLGELGQLAQRCHPAQRSGAGSPACHAIHDQLEPASQHRHGKLRYDHPRPARRQHPRRKPEFHLQHHLYNQGSGMEALYLSLLAAHLWGPGSKYYIA
ncbi:hypothetical protein D9M69_510860 [compost metagenome]